MNRFIESRCDKGSALLEKHLCVAECNGDEGLDLTQEHEGFEE